MYILFNKRTRNPEFYLAHPAKTAGTFVRNTIEADYKGYFFEAPQDFLKPNVRNMHSTKIGRPWNNWTTHRPFDIMCQMFTNFLDIDIPIIGTVRHPYDRFVSQLRYIAPMIIGHPPFGDSNTFHSWESAIETFGGWVWELYIPQHAYFFSREKQIGTFYKIEDVQGQQIKFTDNITVDFSKPKYWTHEQAVDWKLNNIENLKTEKKFQISSFTLTDELKEVCYRIYQKDFELFGYDK